MRGYCSLASLPLKYTLILLAVPLPPLLIRRVGSEQRKLSCSKPPAPRSNCLVWGTHRRNQPIGIANVQPAAGLQPELGAKSPEEV